MHNFFFKNFFLSFTGCPKVPRYSSCDRISPLFLQPEQRLSMSPEIATQSDSKVPRKNQRSLAPASSPCRPATAERLLPAIQPEILQDGWQRLWLALKENTVFTRVFFPTFSAPFYR